MVPKISSCSISLILCLLLSLPAWAQGGNASGSRQGTAAKKKEKKKVEIEYPLYNGLSVGLDLWGIGGKLLGGDCLSSEASVDVNLKNRYFPTVEIGYGAADSWSDRGIHYKTSAPYFRIGADYNTLYNKKHGNMLMVGLRYGTTRFDYDVTSAGPDDPIYGGTAGNPVLTDDVWKESRPYIHKGMKGSMGWAEFCVGLRAHVCKSLYMGWSLRFRFKMSGGGDTYGDPWYVPGFGQYNSKATGITYTLIYKLPSKKL